MQSQEKVMVENLRDRKCSDKFESEMEERRRNFTMDINMEESLKALKDVLKMLLK